MVELSELIRELRAELGAAVAAAPAEGLRFELGPVEIEVSVAVDKRGGSGGKVKFWVLELGSDAAIARNSVQRVKVTLVPQIANSDAQPYVSGTQETAEG
ncbi:trypco2 family protein [Streptomyces sp. NPDC006602]|uniref:trypco2 family protein n=1 Tax=Streptomyces sp. NPDC006602 TaxID=3364751 RepID=UPI00367568D6